MDESLSKEDLEKLYASGKIAFSSIPKNKRTQKSWYIAVLKGDVKAEDLPRKFQIQEFFDLYFSRCFDIRKIPSKYRTQEMANKDFETRKDIRRIPNEYQTQEMSEKDFEIYQDITRILLHFRTQEMANKDFEVHQDIKRITLELITQELANKDFEVHQDIKRIPEEYLTKELAEKDFEVHQDIRRIPNEHQTQEMSEKDFEIYQDITRILLHFRTQEMANKDFEVHQDIRRIPNEYQTQEMSEKDFEIYKDITRILLHFRTQEMANKDFEVHQDVMVIPSKYRTQEMANKDFETRKDIRRIPNEYQTQEMSEKDFEIYQDITRILLHFRTQEMANKDFEVHQDVMVIPSKYRTQELAEKDFESHQDIMRIPEELITQEMIEKYYDVLRNKSNIPEESYTRETLLENLIMGEELSGKQLKILFPGENVGVFSWETYYLKDIPKSLLTEEFYDELVNIIKSNLEKYYPHLNNDLKYRVLKSELINLVETGGTKEEIEEKYNISSIDWVINRLEKDDPDLFEKVKKIFEENANTWFQTMLVDIINLRTIIQNLGDLNPNKLTPEQKINFTYNLSKAGTHHSLAEINEFLERYPMYGDEDFTSVQSFFRHHLNFKYKKMAKSDEVALYDNEKYLAKNGQNWLRKFDLNETFKVKDGKPTATLKYLTPDGEALELTIDKANEILDYLKENEVPLRSCIVNEAFRRYARGELDNFINELENGYGEKTK